MNVEVYYDDKVQMLNTLENDKRLYFKRGMKKDDVIRYYRDICAVQGNNSSHKYTSNVFELPNEAVALDLGAAKGNFIVKNLDKIKKDILVEYDKEWVETLKMIFAGELKDGTIVIKDKMVSNINDVDHLTIDKIASEYSKKNDDNDNIKFIKMDIESMKLKALGEGYLY